MTGWWLASCNPNALRISVGSPRLCTGHPRTDSGLYVLLSGKRAHPQSGRSLLPFFNNSNRSPENSVLCKPEMAGCSRTNKQRDYHYFRRAGLMSNALFQHDSQWQRTRYFHSYLLVKDTCRMVEGSAPCQLMFPQAPCYGIVHSQYEVIG